MKVYVILEDQLDDDERTVIGTYVMDVYEDKERAEEAVVDLKEYNIEIQKKYFTNPCKYRIQECPLM